MSKVDDLRKKLSAMKIKGSKAITLDIDYIQGLVDDIDSIESTINQVVENNNENNLKKNGKIVLHGGKFK